MRTIVELSPRVEKNKISYRNILHFEKFFWPELTFMTTTNYNDKMAGFEPRNDDSEDGDFPLIFEGSGNEDSLEAPPETEAANGGKFEKETGHCNNV